MAHSQAQKIGWVRIGKRMTTYILRRLMIAVPTLMAISIVSFIIIQLPRGDYLDRRIQELEEQYGDSSSMEMAEELRQRYGLDKSMPERYFFLDY